MTEREMAVESIRVIGRHRKDVGDLTKLVESLKTLGLLHPVTVTEDGRLLAGQRRLAAAVALGWKSISVRIVTTQRDAIEELRIERDENTERLEMKPSELVSLGLQLEALERPRAAARSESNLRHGASITSGESDISRGPTRDVVAAALGTTAWKYEKAKRVVEAASQPDASEETKRVAEEMDKGKLSITEAHRKINGGGVGPRTRSAIGSAREQRKAIGRMTELLENLAKHSIPLFVEIHADVTKEEAAQWVDSLLRSRAELSTFINLLREYIK